MSTTYQSIFSEAELQYILNLPEVITSKEAIDKKESGSIYFNSVLTQDIRAKLTQTFNKDYSNAESIPLRWIKGDTSRHRDTGANSFQNTYLVYINTSVGELVLNDTSYPIVAGTGYVFSEGIHHETRNTLSTPRLLIGPMSETGLSVGAASTTLTGDGAVDIFYIRQGDTFIEYQKNSEGWYTIAPLPVYINNTNGNPSTNILKVIFTTNIIVDSVNFYFICNSNGIQFGSSSLNNGAPVNIDISGVVNYDGLIQNGTIPYDPTGGGYNNIYVYNLNVSSSNGSTLNSDSYGGWVCRPYYGRNALNNYIINCSSTGAINDYCGGILGGYAACSDNASSSTLYIYGCSSSGNIGNGGGGIVGISAADTSADPTATSEIYIEQCYSTGAIVVNAGGIVGMNSAEGGYISVIKSYSTGSIGQNAGGIVGANSGGTLEDTEAHLDVESCYSTGSIAINAGGIYGTFNLNANATNCYSTGSIDSDAYGGGIFGNSSLTNTTATHCYASGPTNYVDGYIFGGSVTVPPSCYSEAANSSSGWNSTNANTALTGVPTSGIVGTSWVARVYNSPYELNGLGYTPYTNDVITSTSQLNQTYSQTIQAGGTSVESINADASGNNITLLAIQNGNPSSYGSITINSQTGVISTTSSTAPATYTLIIRSVGSYNITYFNLTIAGDSGEGVANVSCCNRTMNLKGLDYATRNMIIAGNVIIGSSAVQRKPVSSSELLIRKMAYASKF